jgi:porin
MRAFIMVWLLLFTIRTVPAQQSERAGVPDDTAPISAGVPPVFSGVTFSAAVKNELWSVARGGLEQRQHFLFNADLTAEADLGTSLGFDDAVFYLHLLANNGNSLSSSVGDVQMVSNIEGYRTVKLYQCWLRKEIPSLNASVLFGVYDLNSEFYVTPTSALFLNGSHGIGIDVGQTGKNGPSIFPNTALAFRLQWNPSNDLLFMTAVTDGFPGAPENCNSFDLSIRNGDGYFLIGEANYLGSGSDKFGAGCWYYTGSYADVCAVDGLEEYSERKDNAGFYLIADKTLFNESGSGAEGLAFFVRAGAANHHLNSIQYHAGGGFTYTGLLEGRDEDRIGYAVALASFGSDFRKLNTFLGTDVTDFEAAHELTYRTELFPQLAVQFDLQYIVHPSGAVTISNVLVGGLRAEIAL